MTTYFGLDPTGSSDNSGGNASIWNISLVLTCPGVGDQEIQELSAYVDNNGAGTPHIRVAIYSADGATRIAQGAAEVTAPGVRAWTGHLTPADITPNPATLVGGTSYVLVVTMDGDVGSEKSTGTDGNYDLVDYTGGFPATWTIGVAGGSSWCVRCGVDPAGAPALNVDVEPANAVYGVPSVKIIG